LGIKKDNKEREFLTDMPLFLDDKTCCLNSLISEYKGMSFTWFFSRFFSKKLAAGWFFS
jgi:hypothetical protein